MLVTSVRTVLAVCLATIVFAAPRQEQEPQRVRSFGGLPDWARESWLLRRQIEEQVIAMLNSKDRLAGFRRANRRLFPAD